MISVIIPIYNGEKYIRKCVESVLNQTYSDLEVIIVDDASTDETVKVCEELQKESEKVILLKQEVNGGQVKAYKAGLNIAKGEYIAFVDGDDWIAPDMMSELYVALKDNDADISACGCYHVFENRTIVEPADITEIGQKIYMADEIHEAFYHLHKPGNFIDEQLKLYRWNKLVKKEIILANLQWTQDDIRVFEDNNVAIPCIMDAKKIVYVNKPLYYYRRTNGSTMSLFNEVVLQRMRDFLDNQENLYKEKKIEHKMKFDAYIAYDYCLNKLLVSGNDDDSKCTMLEMIRKQMAKYGVSAISAVQMKASLKHVLLILLVRMRLYRLILAIK